VTGPARGADPRPGPSSMARWVTRGDGIDALTREVVAVPQPQAGELLVEVEAWSLNYRDLLVVDGVGGWRPAGPIAPVSDAAGTVVAAGPGVDRFVVGDRVSAAFLPQWREGPLTPATYTRPVGGPVNRGMLAQYVLVDEHEAVRTPAALTAAQAATLPVAAVTAWHAVVERLAVSEDETVLVHGTGGVALFAAQFALARGAAVVITSSSDDKLHRLRDLGGDLHLVNYRTRDVVTAVAELTAGRGADHVVETVGGENLNTSLRAVRLGGAIAFVGLIQGLSAPVNTYEFVTKNVTVHGIETGSQDMYRRMAGFVDDHVIVPLVDRVFDFDAAPEALRHLEQGRHLGKVVILPGASGAGS